MRCYWRSILLVFSFFVCVCESHAQFDAQVGLYSFLPVAYNPSFVGVDDLMRLEGMHRRQFIGMNGAPITTFFCFSTPFRVLDTKHGAGVRFLNDRFGLFSNQALHVQYAYMRQIWGGVLSVGAEMGYINVKFSADSINLKDFEDSYHSSEDEAIPEGAAITGMKFDFGFGIYFARREWYVGGSFQHAGYPKVDWSENSDFHVRGLMCLTGGYHWQTNHPMWRLEPSMLVMSDFRDYDINLTMRAVFLDRFQGGVSYRIAENVGFIAGVEVISGLQIIYTYELPHSKILRESSGTHEIYLSYGFEILRPRHTNRYKSIRYL